MRWETDLKPAASTDEWFHKFTLTTRGADLGEDSEAGGRRKAGGTDSLICGVTRFAARRLGKDAGGDT